VALSFFLKYKHGGKLQSHRVKVTARARVFYSYRYFIIFYFGGFQLAKIDITKSARPGNLIWRFCYKTGRKIEQKIVVFSSKMAVFC